MTVETGRLRAPIWRAVFVFIFQRISVALQRRHALIELNGLSDRYLRDIGVDRQQISELVKREITQSGLREAGWPSRHPPRRR